MTSDDFFKTREFPRGVQAGGILPTQEVQDLILDGPFPPFMSLMVLNTTDVDVLIWDQTYGDEDHALRIPFDVDSDLRRGINKRYDFYAPMHHGRPDDRVILSVKAVDADATTGGIYIEYT